MAGEGSMVTRGLIVKHRGGWTDPEASEEPWEGFIGERRDLEYTLEGPLAVSVEKGLE